ncbi:MAG TPA: MauE/DoxX family redox-associated membrane protein, partial [Candidatus Dormibacteraeota bacterium]|nr:MauE/DoxX family redox-associated membrane protein [Candidatus Dormibacteraeota bacterium]
MDLQQQTKIEAIAPGSPVKRGCASDWVAVAGRWVLGLVFIYMGVSKALEPDEFLKLVRQYELVSNFYLLNILAAALPWFEIFCGLLLLTGVAVRGAALVSLGMLVPFSLLVLKRALEVASAKGL